MTKSSAAVAPNATSRLPIDWALLMPPATVRVAKPATGAQLSPPSSVNHRPPCPAPA